MRRHLLLLLVLLLGCSESPVVPETGLLLRLVDANGLLVAGDEVRVRLEGPITRVQALAPQDSILFEDLSAGTYRIAVELLADGAVLGFGDRSVEVADERTAEESVRLGPFVPDGVEATTEGESVSLSWAPVDGATAYRVEASGLPDTEGFVHQGETEETTFVVEALPAGTYLFRVLAINRLGAAGVPAEASVTREDHSLRVLYPIADGIDSFGRAYSDPPGVDCGIGIDRGEVCLATYPAGTEVALELEWEYGVYTSTFGGWSGGGCSGFDACVVIMDGDKEVQAIRAYEYGALAVDIDVQAPEGFAETVFVRSDPGWMDCRKEAQRDGVSEQCLYPFPFGVMVELVLTDSNGQQGLTGVAWEGCDDTDGRICSVEIREGAPLSVKATATYQ